VRVSLLDLTDLVFIDPVMNRLQSAPPRTGRNKFHGGQQTSSRRPDCHSSLLTRNGTLGLAEVLAGESTARRGRRAWPYFRTPRRQPHGILLISSILNFQTTGFSEGNDLPYALFLPTYTATAWYHQEGRRTARRSEEGAGRGRGVRENDTRWPLMRASSR